MASGSLRATAATAASPSACARSSSASSSALPGLAVRAVDAVPGQPAGGRELAERIRGGGVRAGGGVGARKAQTTREDALLPTRSTLTSMWCWLARRILRNRWRSTRAIFARRAARSSGCTPAGRT